MARSAWLGGTAWALLCLGCTPAARPDLTDAQRAAIADSILAITRGFSEAASALDVDRFASLFASDPAFSFASDGQLMLISHDSLRSFYRSVYAGFRKMESAWDTLQVSVLGPDAAVLNGAGHFAVTDMAGHVVRQAMAVTYVFVRRDNKWQLLHGHASHRMLPP